MITGLYEYMNLYSHHNAENGSKTCYSELAIVLNTKWEKM